MPPRKAEHTPFTHEAAPVAAPEETPKLPKVKAPRTMLRADAINEYFVHAAPDHALEQVLDLQYLWHDHGRFRPGDIVTIRHPYFLWEVEILIREIDTEAKAILGFYRTRDLREEKLAVPDLAEASIEFMGGPHMWAVKNGTDHMKTGFETQGEAEAWLRKKQARGN